MKCPFCNTENADNAANCICCGAALQGNPVMGSNVSQGFTQGSSQGSFQGNPQGFTQGNPQGAFQGNPQGFTQGSSQGSFQGSPQGFSQGMPQEMPQGTRQGKPGKSGKAGLSIGGILLIIVSVFVGRYVGRSCGRAIGEEMSGRKPAPTYSFDATKAQEELRAKVEELDEKVKPIREAADAVYNIAGSESGSAAADPDTASGDLSLGTTTKDTYENESLGFGCRLEGWDFADKARLAEISGIKGNLPEDIQEIVDKNGYVLVMWASAPDSQSTVNVQVQNVKQQFGTTFTEEEFTAALPGMLPELKSTLERSGLSNVSVSTEKVRTSDSEYTALVSSGTSSGIKVYTKQLYFIRGDYAAIVTVQSYNTDETDGALKNIYKLD